MTEEWTPSFESRLNLVIPLIFGALFVGVVVLIPLGYIAWEFAGGWDGIRPQADPDSHTVTTARKEALTALPTQQDELDALITPITGEPLARGTAHGCTKGVNNWKIRHGYTLSCATAAVAIYPWPDDPNTFHQLTTTLTEHDYQPESEHSVLESPHHTGAANGWYTSGNTELRLEIHPPGRSLPHIVYPSDDVNGDKDTEEIDLMILRPEQTTLIVVHSRLYFED